MDGPDEPGGGLPEPLGEQEPAVEGEEGRRSKGLTAPMRVSKEEREEHERTHTPYRAWCPVCVKARGRATPHMKSRTKEEEAVPKISMDYFFMSKKDEEAKELEPQVTETG
jgi:hypothetical protein